MALRANPVGPVTRGAVKLRRFIEASGLSLPAFCEAYDLDRFEVQRALKGETQRIDVDFAARIEAATMGPEGQPVVVWRMWLSSTRHAGKVATARTTSTRRARPVNGSAAGRA